MQSLENIFNNFLISYFVHCLIRVEGKMNNKKIGNNLINYSSILLFLLFLIIEQLESV